MVPAQEAPGQKGAGGGDGAVSGGVAGGNKRRRLPEI